MPKQTDRSNPKSDDKIKDRCQHQPFRHHLVTPPTTVISRFIRPRDEDFDDAYTPGTPLVPQAEQFAAKHSMPLNLGWKVDVAEQVKDRLLRAQNPASVPAGTSKTWQELFEKFDR